MPRTVGKDETHFVLVVTPPITSHKNRNNESDNTHTVKTLRQCLICNQSVELSPKIIGKMLLEFLSILFYLYSKVIVGLKEELDFLII